MISREHLVRPHPGGHHEEYLQTFLDQTGGFLKARAAGLRQASAATLLD
jgi:hypothetical protein